jgi:hypothetical protein
MHAKWTIGAIKMTKKIAMMTQKNIKKIHLTTEHRNGRVLLTPTYEAEQTFRFTA